VSSPRLSVVLVVFREQAYLRECVSSVLEQSFRDVELLAVDNASPDHGPEILDELAAQDGRLVVRRLDRTVGLGEARNIALDSATGDYVWFLAATDRLVPGALASVAARLDETAPDVLVVDHTLAEPLGTPKPGPHRTLIRAASEADGFTLDERPRAAELGVDLEDKIFRRAFLRAHDLRFGAGDYGSLGVTYPALFLAERISVLPRVCSSRLELPSAAKEAPGQGSPFDVFEEYDAVFRLADSQGDRLAARRRLLALPMLRHYRSLLAGLPPERRKDFFARMSASYRRHGGEDAPLPEGRRARLEVRLVASGHYRPFRALGWAVARRRALGRRAAALRRLGRRSAGALQRHALRGYYRMQLRAPIDPHLAVFAAYWYRGYSCNPRAIYEKLRELAPSVRGVWVVDSDHVADFPPGVEHVVAGTREYYRVLARAKYFVNNANFPNEFVKRRGTIFVQTHHGTPLKTMGLDLRHAFTAGGRMNFELLLRRTAKWDYSISSNTLSTLVWERVYPTRYETLEIGYPRNDALVNATGADVERIRRELGIAPAQRAVLFAPTHREYLRRYVPTADVGRLAEELGPEHVIMLRLHYFHGRDLELEELRRRGLVLDVTDHPSIEDLCLAADVLVTDYSSIMFDYAVLDRPIVIHAPDWDVYRTLRGTYFDLLAEPPGVVTATDDALVAAFRSGAVWSEPAARLRAAFRARFCALDDGRAAERVVRKVWLPESEEAAPRQESPRPFRARIEA
jgi:CDP-glycerol glycerophosphotransferase